MLQKSGSSGFNTVLSSKVKIKLILGFHVTS